jgi:hypothetical protein
MRCLTQRKARAFLPIQGGKQKSEKSHAETMVRGMLRRSADNRDNDGRRCGKKAKTARA